MQLCRKIDGNIGKAKVDLGNKRVDSPERGGRLTNLLKKTNLKHLVATLDFRGSEAEVNVNNSMDYARFAKRFIHSF